MAAYSLEFHKTTSGSEPALVYIRAQRKAHRAKIGRALQFLEDVGHLARRPKADYLGDEIYELRVAVDKHQHRFLYFFHGRTIIVVTSGFLKNVGKVPKSELDKAQKFRGDWIKRFGGKK